MRFYTNYICVNRTNNEIPMKRNDTEILLHDEPRNTNWFRSTRDEKVINVQGILTIFTRRFINGIIIIVACISIKTLREVGRYEYLAAGRKK